MSADGAQEADGAQGPGKARKTKEKLEKLTGGFLCIFSAKFKDAQRYRYNDRQKDPQKYQRLSNDAYEIAKRPLKGALKDPETIIKTRKNCWGTLN